MWLAKVLAVLLLKTSSICPQGQKVAQDAAGLDCDVVSLDSVSVCKCQRLQSGAGLTIQDAAADHGQFVVDDAENIANGRGSPLRPDHAEYVHFMSFK